MWLIIVAALTPILLFAVLQIGYAARERRLAVQSQALAQADRLITAADGEVLRIGTLLDALATSSALKTGDWAALSMRFAELASLNPDLKGFEVRDLQRDQIGLHVGPRAELRTTIVDGRNAPRPIFIGYAKAGRCRCLLFQRSARGPDDKLLTATLLIDSGTFLHLLPTSGSRFEVSAFNGPQGRFIARTLDNDKRFGQLGSQYLRQAVASRQLSGIYRGFTLEGFKSYTAFARSRHTGWTAHVAFNSGYVDGPGRQFLFWLGSAILISLCLAAVLAYLAMRQFERVRLSDERLQQGQKMEALGQLTGGIAHDFNNLLTPIVGTLDQLSRRDSLDERGRKLAAGALSAARRAAKLTGQLLAFSRRKNLEIGTVRVQPLVTNLIDLVERSFGGRHRFSVHVADGVDCVRSDANQLELALLNLTLNARDASPPGSLIELSVRPSTPGDAKPDAPVLFVVRDEGAGMDAATQRQAVEPFFTTKPIGQGTGLGLAQVSGLASQSGGELRIESALRKGTSVILSLPACPPEATTAEMQVARNYFEESRHLRLLVVDDDAAVRATIVSSLGADGHSVDAVSHGATAIAALETSNFDLLVVDYQMPGMDGAEVIAAARGINPELKVLVATGHADNEALAQSKPAVRIIRKPFSSEELLAAVWACFEPVTDTR